MYKVATTQLSFFAGFTRLTFILIACLILTLSRLALFIRCMLNATQIDSLSFSPLVLQEQREADLRKG
uniref:Uncharacterized protein n=1 Tax=Picea glauca TaxID=3330 RepID=A0A101LYP2_PICGL|nr:hypothetical protein ABT39_MTgene5957 [Picea glauca]